MMGMMGCKVGTHEGKSSLTICINHTDAHDSSLRRDGRRVAFHSVSDAKNPLWV